MIIAIYLFFASKSPIFYIKKNNMYTFLKQTLIFI